jgi:hypothetical protein
MSFFNHLGLIDKFSGRHSCHSGVWSLTNLRLHVVISVARLIVEWQAHARNKSMTNLKNSRIFFDNFQQKVELAKIINDSYYL